MEIRKDWISLPSMIFLILATWTLVMCILVFTANSSWFEALYKTLAVFIGIICVYEVFTGVIQKTVMAHISGTTTSTTPQ